MSSIASSSRCRSVERWALVIAGTVSSLLVTEVVQETVGRVAGDTVQRAALGVIRGERLTVEIPRRIAEHLAAAPPTDRTVDVPEQQAVAVHLVVVAEALLRGALRPRRGVGHRASVLTRADKRDDRARHAVRLGVVRASGPGGCAVSADDAELTSTQSGHLR